LRRKIVLAARKIFVCFHRLHNVDRHPVDVNKRLNPACRKATSR
jgi:hypothetical protein